MQNENDRLKRYGIKTAKIMGWIMGVMLSLFIVLVLMIRSPWGQGMVVLKTTQWVSQKINTPFSIDRLFITFSGNVYLQGIYLQDQQGDTLVYSQDLEASVAILPLIKENTINIDLLDWQGLIARVKRSESTQTFNYEYILEAFSNPDDITPNDTTTSPSSEIEIGNVFFSNFNLVYIDELSGINTSLKLGDLFLNMDEVNLDQMRFTIDELTLKNTSFNHLQDTIAPTKQDSTSSHQDTTSVLPTIVINALNVYQVNLTYASPPTRTYAHSSIGQLELKAPMINLTDQKIALQRFLLKDTDVDLYMYSDSSKPTSSTPALAERTPFEWPDWEISTKHVTFENTHLLLEMDSSELHQETFNPQRVSINGLNLSIHEASLKGKRATLNLNNLSFTERSGFQLQEFSLKTTLDDQKLDVSDLLAKTSNSLIKGNLRGAYASIDESIQSPESLTIRANLSINTLGIQDAFYFDKALKNDPYIQALLQKPISSKIALSGSTKELTAQHFELNWGDSTHIQLQGKGYSLLTLDQMRLNNIEYLISSTRSDLSPLLALDSAGIHIPKIMELSGNLSGTVENLHSETLLKTTDGSLHLTGNFQRSNEGMAFEAQLAVDTLQIGRLLHNDQIGALSCTVETAGNGKDLNSLDATLKGDLQRLNYANYDFTSLQLNGAMKNGTGKVLLKYGDDNLDMDLTAQLQLDSIQTEAEATLNVRGADLMALGITQDDIRVQFDLNTVFKGTPESFDALLDITDGTIVYQQESHELGAFNATAYVREDGTLAHFKSDMVSADLKSNTNPEALITALECQLKHYLIPKLERDSIPGQVEVHANLILKQNTLINEVFFPGIENYEPLIIRLDFNEAKNSLAADFNVPYIDYKGMIIDSLQFQLKGAEKHLDFQLGWAAIKADRIQIDATYVEGSLSNEKLNIHFTSMDRGDPLIYFHSELQMAGDTLQYHITPDTLILNHERWTIPENNQIRMTHGFVDFNEFSISRDHQSIALENTFHDGNENLNVSFDNFELKTITNILNSDDVLADGKMTGEFTIQDLYTKSSFLADLKVHAFEVLHANLGTLSLEGTGSDNNYQFHLALKDGRADLDLQGSYIPDEVAAQLDLKLDLHKIETDILEKFTSEYLSKPSGYLSGNLVITGSTDVPNYEGTLQFHDFGFFVSTLNTGFTIANESLTMDNSGVYFHEFSIQDQVQNTFRLTGDIGTDDLTNPQFDLQLKARNFQALNSDKKDNEMFFGKVGVHLDLSIQGDLEVPIVRGSVGIQDNSAFTVVVPKSQADLVEREGVIVFVDKRNPDDILKRNPNNPASASSQTLKGIDLNVQLRIGKDATFKIVIDERTGDNFQISGVGAFNIGLEPNGRTTLSGNYNVSGGHFEASLYNLVKRRFEMAPGSTISWGGDPLGAALDVSAIYNVKTSAAPLMASKTLDNKFQQKLPFQVYLNVKGTILQPEIGFALDLPEDSRGSLGGEVYTQVQQLNSSEEQLNKQVFSLLVLNRFFPASGSDGSSGGAASIARDNVNDVLAGQLNNFSNKITGNSGFQVDFGLNSYTAYQGETSKERTDLNINASKHLFNDRVVVQVGSEVNIDGSGQQNNEGSPLIGNVSLEYLITENGRYRFNGFRKNEYENVIDGQLIVTGFALIFNKEFNRFKDIWRKEEDVLENELPEEE